MCSILPGAIPPKKHGQRTVDFKHLRITKVTKNIPNFRAGYGCALSTMMSDGFCRPLTASGSTRIRDKGVDLNSPEPVAESSAMLSCQTVREATLGLTGGVVDTMF